MDIGGVTVKQRLINVLFALDCFLFSLLTLGGSYPYESFSSAAWRAEGRGDFYGKARPLIDWLFRVILGQNDHCAKAYFGAKYNLPPDQR